MAFTASSLIFLIGVSSVKPYSFPKPLKYIIEMEFSSVVYQPEA